MPSFFWKSSETRTNMELSAEFESFIQGMEWGEVVFTVEETINALWPDTLNLPSPLPVPAQLKDDPHPQPVETQGGGFAGFIPEGAAPQMAAPNNYGPPPPPPVPCELRVNTVPHPVKTQGGGLGGCFPLGAAPHVMAAPTTTYYEPLYQGDSMLPGHLYSQGDAYRQGQCNGVPVVGVPEGISENLRPVGMLNGEVLYELPPGLFTTPVFVAPPPPANTSQSKKRKRESQQDDDLPYVRKPPNAFMLYLKEQRPNVVADLKNRGSAAVNAVMAQKWNSLTKEEQARYYKQAERERQLHAQQHPGWSTYENYGKKRKRRTERSKAPTRAEEETQHAIELCVTPARVEASTTQAGVTEPRHQQVVWLPDRQTPVIVPVCHMCHLPQLYDISPRPSLQYQQL